LEEVGPTSCGKFLASLLIEANKDEAQESNVSENFNNITLVQIKLKIYNTMHSYLQSAFLLYFLKQTL